MQSIKNVVHRWSIAGRLFGLASGYIDDSRRLLPGHTFALVQLLLSLLVYTALVFGKSISGESEETSLLVPTATSVVLLLVLNSWGLSALTFFFDRYRVPLFTIVVALTTLTGSRGCTDYTVETRNTGSYELVAPGEVLGRFGRPMIVAAAGGGIQAGAWTARVLQGLDEKLTNTALPLRKRLALISGVSGGSMGALYYGAYYDVKLSEATRQSLESSLDGIASAFVGTDHVRRVLGSPCTPIAARRWSAAGHRVFPAAGIL